MKSARVAGLFFLALIISSCAKPDKGIPITTSSKEAREFFIQGRDLYENVEFSAAAKLFDNAIAKDTAFALAYLYRAGAGGGAQVVRPNLAKAQSLSAKVSEGEKALIAYMQAATDADRPKQKEFLDKLLTMYPEDPRVELAAGVYFQTVSDYKSALASYTKATEMDSLYAAAYNYIGYMNILQGNLDAAEKAFKKYISLRPNKPNPYDSYAELLLKMGRYDESIAQYQKAYDTDNLFIGSYAGMGNNYIFKGNFGRARERYQIFSDKATRVTDKLTALYNKALSYMYENKLDEAIKAFEERRVLAENEKQWGAVVNTIAYEGFALGEMGKSVDGLKKMEESVAAIDKADLAPRQKENLKHYSNMWRAFALAFDNKLEKAKASADLYAKEVEARNNPDEKTAVEQVRALIDFKSGKYDATIERLSKLQPDPWALFYQGQALLKKGDKEGAKTLFTKIHNWNQNSLDLAVVWSRTNKELGI